MTEKDQTTQQASDIVLHNASNSLAAKFGWLSEYGWGFLPNIDEYASREAFASYMHEMSEAGLIENHADAMDAARVFVSEMYALRIMDLSSVQLVRLQKPEHGTLTDKDAFRIQKLTDAVMRANKIALEMKDSAGFSRRARSEVGAIGILGWDRLLKDLSEGEKDDGVQDVTSFLLQGRPGRALPEGQRDVFEDAEVMPERTPTPAEMAFLTEGVV